eukprot:4243603-Pyramimonas_sp.AAC.1
MAWQAHPDRVINVVWTASHLDESPELLDSPRQQFFAAGNLAADVWAGVWAELAWEFGLVRTAPDTDRIDSIAHLVRKRARRALMLAASSETGERAGRAPVFKKRSKQEKAIRDSPHQLEQIGSKWRCLQCELIAPGC